MIDFHKTLRTLKISDPLSSSAGGKAVATMPVLTRYFLTYINLALGLVALMFVLTERNCMLDPQSIQAIGPHHHHNFLRSQIWIQWPPNTFLRRKIRKELASIERHNTTVLLLITRGRDIVRKIIRKTVLTDLLRLFIPSFSGLDILEPRARRDTIFEMCKAIKKILLLILKSFS